LATVLNGFLRRSLRNATFYRICNKRLQQHQYGRQVAGPFGLEIHAFVLGNQDHLLRRAMEPASVSEIRRRLEVEFDAINSRICSRLQERDCKRNSHEQKRRCPSSGEGLLYRARFRKCCADSSNANGGVPHFTDNPITMRPAAATEIAHHCWRNVEPMRKALFTRVLLGFEVVGWRGLEPRTNALKGHCSTD
jgi:hypothetical protein